MGRLLARVLTPATIILCAACAALACAKLGLGSGSKGPPTSSSSSSSASSGTDAAASPAGSDAVGGPSKIPAAADMSTPSRPEHLVLRVSYLADAGAPESSMMELEREGAYRLERRGESGDPRDPGVLCSGTLSLDVGASLWKAIDAAAFVPAESGFTKPIQAPRQQNNQQAKYSVTRILADLSMVPSDEAGAKALVNQIRAAISTAEKQASSSGTCTKLPRR